MSDLALWCDLLNPNSQTRQTVNHGFGLILAHTNTKKKFNFSAKYLLKDLNSSEAAVFFGNNKHITCPHEYPLHKEVKQKLVAQLCF